MKNFGGQDNSGRKKEHENNNDSYRDQIILKAFNHHSNGEIQQASKFYQLFLDRGFIDPRVFSNYGVICRQRGLIDQAYNLYRKSIELYPKEPEAYTNLGNILRDQGKLKEAEIYHRKAIKLRPNFAEAHSNLGTLLKDIGKLQEAEFSIRKAIEINPNYVDAYTNLGVILKALGQGENAELFIRKAVELQPNNPNSHLNLAIVLLTCKKFIEGWQEYEWRWRMENYAIGIPHQTIKPEWSLGNRGRVLLWAEQGLGDELLFLSLVPDFIDKVDKLILKIDKRLIPLVNRTFHERIDVISNNELIDEDKYDFHIAMGTLPRFLRPNLSSFITSKKLILKVNESKSQELRSEIIDENFDKVVGISWKSNSKINSRKSISLEDFILGIYSPRIRFVSLQYGDVSNEINFVNKQYGIEILEVNAVDKFNDIDNLAALIKACDEVVSVGNVNVHLSALLGFSSKILVPNNNLFYLGINDDESYWYPSVKLYRQSKTGEWDDQLAKIKDEIRSKNSI